MNLQLPTSASRRTLLQGMGALIVAAPLAGEVGVAAAQAAPGAKPALVPSELDSWVAVARDGKVTAFFGKPDVGQGVDVAIAQIVAEELDVPVDRVAVVLADSGLTCNQGGVSGSTGIQRGGVALRYAAAEARRLLVERAAAKLGVAPEGLTVVDGVVSSTAEPTKRVAYGELVDGYFNAKLDWNNQWGNALDAKGKAKPKSPADYKIVGQSPPRRDIPGKVTGSYEYIADLRVPGMLHGRVIRPATAGATPVKVDAASIAAVPGARVVHKKDFLGVVAPSEWDAIRAARLLDVTWSQPKEVFPEHADLYDDIRKAPVEKAETAVNVGAAGDALSKAAHVISAEYEWPYQSHASMSGACGVADVTPGGITCWTATQKPHALWESVAKLTGRPQASVRVIGMSGPGSYGRNDAGDATMDAVVMSEAVGKPVRVQYMRHEGTAWDPKGAPSIHKVRASLTADGRIDAFDFVSKGVSRMDVATAETEPRDTLAGQLLGFTNKPAPGFGVPDDNYVFPHKRTGWEVIPTYLANGSPLRTSHFRDPLGPQIHFASESFMDELALAAKADPVEFRLAHLKAPRDIGVVKAAAEKAGWTAGPPGARRKVKGNIASGRGFAYVQRGGTVVAVVADVEVDRKTGRVWPKRFTVAHDCGLIVNPAGLKSCIEGNVVQGCSRALFEEVKFDTSSVKSVDWQSYPILEIADAPEAVDVVLINRPELAPQGAGEPSHRPIAAAIANAIFDATGARVRSVPFTPERVKAAMAKVV
jgi:CO/xanthine dehydrogenase Mo-binding subunit